MNKELLAMAFEIKKGLRETEQALEKMIIALADEGRWQAEGVPSIPKQPLSGTPTSTRAVTLLDLKEGEFKFTKPSSVQFPDGTMSERLNHWKNVVTEIVNWHIQKGYIAGDTPRPGAGREYPVVSRNKDALQAHGGDPDSYFAEVNGWWVDTWGAVSKRKQRNLVEICRSVGTNPADFKITIRP